MNRSIMTILLIFIIPLLLYWGLTKNKSVTILSGEASGEPVIIKFSSPMCYECQELEKIFKGVYPLYVSKVKLVKVDVTENSINADELIKKYAVTLVPTTIFQDKNGKITRRIEGSMQPAILENYIKEIINE